VVCSSCGTQLPEDAKFCLKCGKPQKPGLPAEEVRWETCEIGEENVKQAGNLSVRENRFVGKAIGPSGVYIVEVSATFKFGAGVLDPSSSAKYPSLRDWSKECVSILDTFISKLVAEGWEPIGTQHGLRWYSYKFRRRIKA
jgi:zinc-ribbon domain